MEYSVIPFLRRLETNDSPTRAPLSERLKDGNEQSIRPDYRYREVAIPLLLHCVTMPDAPVEHR
jgi:hypothetical protein